MERCPTVTLNLSRGSFTLLDGTIPEDCRKAFAIPEEALEEPEHANGTDGVRGHSATPKHGR